MSDSTNLQNPIDAEAARWLIRLASRNFSAAERTELSAWRQRDAAHEAAFRRASMVWQDLAMLPAGSPKPRRRTSRKWTQMAMAASLLIALLLGAFYAGDPLTLVMADYRTAPGEVRTVELADGSRVILNTASAIAIDFGADERRVRLLAGEASFAALPAADAGNRSFVVSTDGIDVRALGTEFIVRRTERGAQVTVLEHSVAVVPASSGSSKLAPVVIFRGQSVSYDAEEGIGTPSDVEPNRASAWMRNRLVFDRIRLDEAVAELNRYRRGRIIVTDDELAGLTVSGVFRIDELDDALAVIAAELNADTASVPPFVTLLY